MTSSAFFKTKYVYSSKIEINNYKFILLTFFYAILLFFFSFVPETSKAQINTKKSYLKTEVKSRWSSSVNWSMSKNQDYYSDYFTKLSGSLNYKASKRLNVGIEVGYAQPIDNDYEKLRRYGFEDMSASAEWTYGILNRYTKISPFISVTLPTSKSSYIAGLYTSLGGGFKLSRRFNWGSLGSSHSINYSFYEFDTSDESGTDPNSPLMISNSLSSTINLVKDTKLSFSYGHNWVKTYFETEYQVQTLSASIGYSWNKNLDTGFGVFWKDRVVTSNQLFDDDNTITKFSLTMSF